MFIYILNLNLNLNYKTFKTEEESKISFERDELLLKFISLAIEKFEQIRDTSLI